MNLSNVCVRSNILFLRCRVALNSKSIDLDGLFSVSFCDPIKYGKSSQEINIHVQSQGM